MLSTFSSLPEKRRKRNCCWRCRVNRKLHAAKPEDVEKLLELESLFRQFAAAVVGRRPATGVAKRMQKESGHSKRVASFKKNIKDQLLQLRREHERGDVFAKYDALVVARDVSQLPENWVIDAILQDARARFAGKSVRTRQLQTVEDWIVDAKFRNIRQGVRSD